VAGSLAIDHWPLPKMIRAVIFDFNGVLVDDEHVHFELLRDVLAEEGITLSERAYYDEYLGYDDRGCFETALVRAGQPLDSARIEGLIARKAARYATRAEGGLKLFPGASGAVAGLAEAWPVAVCSGALRPEIEYGLGRLGVREHVAAIIAAEDTDRCKPDPEGYFLALDALRADGHEDLEAGHCLVFEDSLAGVESGKAAGMWVVGVTHTYPADELRRAGADATIASLAPLNPDWVRRMFAPEVSP
jgi:HAD superfamily hydrolase (TIGR01509 family)